MVPQEPHVSIALAPTAAWHLPNAEWNPQHEAGCQSTNWEVIGPISGSAGDLCCPLLCWLFVLVALEPGC